MMGDVGGATTVAMYQPAPKSTSSSIRPYKCLVCHRSFREVATLRKHEQLHRADRPYICTTCGKSFLWSSNLKVHERVHTGERPYKCKICHRCFTQSNDLRRHERNVHMRNKSALTSYKSPPEASHHQAANMAAYQALAMQQRAAFLHQAMAYENMMHNAAAAQQQQASIPAAAVSSNTSSPTNTHPLSVSRLTANSTTNQRHAPMVPEMNDVKTEDISPPLSPASVDIGRRRAELNDKEHKYLVEQSMLQRQQYAMTINRQLVPLPMPMIQTVMPQQRSLSAMSHGSNQSPRLSPSPPYTFPGSLPVPMLNMRASPHTPLPHAHQNRVSPSMRCHVEDGIDLRLNKPVAPRGPPSLGTKQSPKEADVALSSPSSLHKRSYSDESDDKRDVTTTSESPVSEDGFYQCNHCQVFFRDFTMFHLHESLHLPQGADPFRCPSCGKHCQDRIEFNFHLVWHVRYPHTIPNYQPLQSYLMTATCSG